MTDRERNLQREVEYLTGQLETARRKVTTLITRYEADCLSCAVRDTLKCKRCSQRVKNQYVPIGTTEKDRRK